MANSFTREFETLEALIEAQSKSAEDYKWPVVACLSVIDVLNEYWEIIENEPEAVDEDFQGRTIDTIQDVIHSLIVHQELPLTEEQAIALEDQQVAEFRNDLENIGDRLGIDLRIVDLDQKLKAAFDPNPEEKEEKDGDSV